MYNTLSPLDNVPTCPNNSIRSILRRPYYHRCRWSLHRYHGMYMRTELSEHEQKPPGVEADVGWNVILLPSVDNSVSATCSFIICRRYTSPSLLAVSANKKDREPFWRRKLYCCSLLIGTLSVVVVVDATFLSYGMEVLLLLLLLNVCNVLRNFISRPFMG